jgi:hypothetical protein
MPVPYPYRVQGRDIFPTPITRRIQTPIRPAVGVSYITYHVPGLNIGGSDSVRAGRGRRVIN